MSHNLGSEFTLLLLLLPLPLFPLLLLPLFLESLVMVLLLPLFWGSLVMVVVLLVELVKAQVLLQFISWSRFRLHVITLLRPLFCLCLPCPLPTISLS
jgi:hypothetical protein